MNGITYDRNIGKKAKKSIQSYIYSGFPATERYNNSYTPQKLLDVITYSIANGYFIEEASELLKQRRKKTADADTVFYRIKPVTVPQVIRYAETVNNQILATAKSLGAFNEPHTCGLDWHDIDLYSKKIKEAIRTDPKAGTEYALRYLSIESVEDGKRFTFHALPITPLTNLCDAISKLISKASKYVEIKLTLMDRAFSMQIYLSFLFQIIFHI